MQSRQQSETLTHKLVCKGINPDLNGNLIFFTPVCKSLFLKQQVHKSIVKTRGKVFTLLIITSIKTGWGSAQREIPVRTFTHIRLRFVVILLIKV